MKMTNPIVEQVIGPEISKAIVSAIGDERLDDIVVKAKVDEQIVLLVDALGGRSIAAWYQFYGNKDECLHLQDGTTYQVIDAVYNGNGIFGVQLIKR